MIDKLTDEQVTMMPVFRDKWLKIGLSTEAAVRPEAESAINEIYRCAGLNPPRKIIWCGSPLSQGLTRAIILDKRVRDSVGASVRASVWDSVWASVRDSVGVLRPGTAIPTEFKGTIYRSRLEANVAQFLCDMGLKLTEVGNYSGSDSE